MMLSTIYNQSYEEILETYANYFRTEFGERKYESVYKKLKGSNKISSLIVDAGQRQIMPNAGDILSTINTIGFFIFSSGQVQALGALLAFASWNVNYNEYYQIADRYKLKNVAIQIIKESASTFH